MSKGWTKDENNLLRENYARLGSEGCALLLSGRTRFAVQQQVQKLKIPGKRGVRSEYEHLWPFVEALYMAGAGPVLISRETGIAAQQVRGYIKRAGLTELRELAVTERVEKVRAEYQNAPGGG